MATTTETCLRVASLFTGIGGLDLALERAGMKIVVQCEIDKRCQRVLAKRFEGVPIHDDVLTFRGERGAADVVCGGSPCQDISVAGKRAGLAGERSRLFHEFVRVTDEIAPEWVLFENVDGLLSSNDGEDLAVVVGEFTGWRPRVPEGGWRTSGVCIGPKRSVAWRVLDAQYFGLAQRRHRLFVVGHSRSDRAFSILHQPESSYRDHPPVHEARADLAGFVEGGVAKPLGSLTGGIRTTDVESETYVPVVANTLTASGGPSQRTSPSRMMDDDTNLVAVFRKSRRAADPDDDETWVRADTSNTVNTFDDGDVRSTELVVMRPFVFEPRIARNGRGAPEEIVPPLKAQSGRSSTGDSAPIVVQMTPFAFAPRYFDGEKTRPSGRPGDVVPTLRTDDRSGDTAPHIMTGDFTVRRLTVTERERLQGFPDGWTCLCDVTPYSTMTCTCPDGPRARAIGNAVPVPVARWIADRMVRA